LPDAADRIRNEPAARPRGKPAPTAGAKWLSALKPKSKRSVAAAALWAVMIGIVVNAVALQHGRRIAPSADSAVAAVAPVAAPTPAKAAAPEPPRPSPSPATVALAHSPKAADPIADFLRNQGADKRQLTLAAQSALARLGFDVKATGALDAGTRDALNEFEKSHRLPASSEITAKLVKSLTAAVAAN
jgi:hypothetical protein